MKKILVPTDFSLAAKNAIKVAASIAKKANGKLILLHVIEQPTGESYTITGEVVSSNNWEDKLFILKLIAKSKNQLAALADELKEDDVKVTTELRLGNAYHGIRTIITETDVDLVVMGTAGHSKIEEMIIGSTTEKVVRHAHCPVLTIHGKPSNNEYKNIVYATSLNDNEKDFASVIKNTQKLYDSTVHLVRINTPNNFQPDEKVKKAMETFAKKLKLENYTLNIFNDYSEEEGIIRFSESINADMIAMATHGRKGFAHVLVGSIAEDVVNHAKRPVLTFVTK
jgi:nucleotide-binding universal stress UspA family protein